MINERNLEIYSAKLSLSTICVPKGATDRIGTRAGSAFYLEVV